LRCPRALRLFSNPRPVLLAEDTYTLRPGEAQHCDLKASDLSKEHLDKTGRAQIRPFVRSSTRTVCANLEVFDSKNRENEHNSPIARSGSSRMNAAPS